MSIDLFLLFVEGLPSHCVLTWRGDKLSKKSQNVVRISLAVRAGGDNPYEILCREHGDALDCFLKLHLALDNDPDNIVADIMLRLSRVENIADRMAENSDSLRPFLFAMAKQFAVECCGNDLRLADHEYLEQSRRRRNEINSIGRGLRRVNDEQRRTFEMCRLEHKSFQAIGQELGISVNEVEKNFSAVLCALRQEIDL